MRSRRLGTAHRIITVVWCRSTYVYVVQPYNLPLNLILRSSFISWIQYSPVQGGIEAIITGGPITLVLH